MVILKKYPMKKFLQKRIILWTANLALFAALGYIATGLITNDETGQKPTVTQSDNKANTDAPLAANTPAKTNNNVILERDIFQAAARNTIKVVTPKVEIQKPVEPAPEPKLNLKLIATIAGDRNFARAVIENTKSRKQNLYKIGDVIDGAKIERIERNTITLAFAGSQRTLNISAPETNPTIARSDTASITGQKLNFAKIVNITSPTHRQIYKNSKFVKNGGMQAALKALQTMPTEIDEKTKGLRITGLEKDSLARHVGLKNGDIITKINGQVPTNKRKAFQILRSARKRSKLDLDLLQGKKQRVLSFKMI